MRFWPPSPRHDMQLHVGRPSGGDGGGGHCLEDATHAKSKEARRLLKEERLRAKKEQKVLRTEIARLRLRDGKLERGSRSGADAARAQGAEPDGGKGAGGAARGG